MNYENVSRMPNDKRRRRVMSIEPLLEQEPSSVRSGM